MLERVAVIGFISLFLIPSLAFGASSQWKCSLDQGEGVVQFEAVGRPSQLKIHGKSASVPKGTLTFERGRLTGTASFDLNSLETGISLRDEHMKKKYLEVQKFPQAKLEITELSLGTSAGPVRVSGVPVKGNLWLHGVKHAVVGKADVERAGAQLSLTLDFEVHLKEHQIAVPNYAGITVAEIVRVHVEEKAPIR